MFWLSTCQKNTNILFQVCLAGRIFSSKTLFIVRLTNFQRELYQFYLDNISTKGEKAVNTKGRSVSGLFTDYQNLMRVWTHPKLLETHSLKREFAELLIEKVRFPVIFDRTGSRTFYESMILGGGRGGY